jgi:VWFA-related protein
MELLKRKLPRESALLIALLLSLAPARLQSQDSQTGANFSVSVNLVKVPISVFDEDGNMVETLRSEDFRLYENGVRQQIRSFGIDRNPVSVILVIDSSGTVEKELKKIKEAAESFALALSPEDRISVISFSDEAHLDLSWTDDKKMVRKALRKVEPGLRTALYDAMFMAANDQFKGIEGRKAIILLTDGLNNQSSIGFREASLSVVQSQASLYIVAKTAIVRKEAPNQRRVAILSDIYKRMFGEDEDYIEEFFRKRETELSNLAENTGGRAFFPSDYDRIKGSYAEVAKELKSKYFLTYVSNRGKAPNSYNRIGLEYLPPSSKLIFRQGYYYQPAPIHKRRY